MCTALFLLDVHPSILFLLVFNRDEFYQRWARLISQQCIHPFELAFLFLQGALPIQANEGGAVLGGQAGHPSGQRPGGRRYMAGRHSHRPLCIPHKFSGGEGAGSTTHCIPQGVAFNASTMPGASDAAFDVPAHVAGALPKRAELAQPRRAARGVPGLESGPAGVPALHTAAGLLRKPC